MKVCNVGRNTAYAVVVTNTLAKRTIVSLSSQRTAFKAKAGMLSAQVGDLRPGACTRVVLKITSRGTPVGR